MFKVNDKVIGKENNGLVKDNTFLMRIVKVFNEDSVERVDILVLAVYAPSRQSMVGATLTNLNSDCFVLATEEDEKRIKRVKDKPVKADKKLDFGGNLSVSFFTTPEGEKIESNFNEERQIMVESDEKRIKAFHELLNEFGSKSKDELKKIPMLEVFKQEKYKVFNDIVDLKIVEKSLDNLINFFKEFNFIPAFRFVNTLGHKMQEEGLKGATYYTTKYFELCGSSYASAVAEKVKSDEYKQILNNISVMPLTQDVNTRFKVYYGPAGTGKTTRANKETDNMCIVCNSSMLPDDLLSDFVFEDGKPTFQESALRTCLTKGKEITFDEINLLPIDTIRFLQGILDGKESFIYKGETIKIADGFQIIATMNLVVNGVTYGLTEPLVDRAYDIQEFELTGKDLVSALM